MRKLIHVLLALVLTASVFAGGAKEETGKAGEEVVLEFPSWQATEPATSAFWKALSSEFEAQHSGVKVNFYHVPYDGYVNGMVARFAAGDPPDICHLPARDLYTFTVEDWLEPLEPVVGDALKEWTPLESWCVVDGHTVLILALGYGYVMAYNELLLDEAGVKIPVNWDEMREAAAKVSKDTDKDGANDQWGLFMSTADEDNSHDVTISVLSIGLNGEKITSDNGKFNEGIFKSTLEYSRSLIETGALAPGVSRLVGRQLFADGKVGMIIDGPWITGYIDKADEKLRPHLKVTLVPSSAENGVAGGVSNGLSVPKAIDANKKELVYEFIKLFATKEWQKKYGTVAGQPPARQGVFTQEELSKMDRLPVFIDCAQYAVNLVPRAVAARFGEYRKVIRDNFFAYVLRGVPLDKATEAAKKGVASLVK